MESSVTHARKQTSGDGWGAWEERLVMLDWFLWFVVLAVVLVIDPSLFLPILQVWLSNRLDNLVSYPISSQ